MVVRNLLLRAGADFSGIDKAMKKSAKQTKQFRQNFAKTTKRIAQLSVIAGTATIYAAAKAIKAAEEEMVVQKQLSVVMKQRMDATDATVQSIIDLASEQQKVGVIEDGAIMSGAQMLGTFLKQSESLKTLIPAMNDLAAQQYGLNATSEGLVTIGKMMGKVFTGQTGALIKAGISFSAAQEEVLKYGTESEKAAMLSKIITENVGNMNEELGNTPMGRIVQLKNSFGDLQENLGKALMPLRDAFVPALQKAIDYFDALIIRMKPAIQFAQIFLETLFNVKAAKNSAAIAGNTEDQADALKEVGKEAKKATKQLFGFDEINQIQEDLAESTEDTANANKYEIETGEDLANTMMLTTEQIQKAKEKAEQFKETLNNLKDVAIGFKDEAVRLYNQFIKPFVDKLTGWDGEKTNSDFELVGATIADILVTYAAIKGVLTFLTTAQMLAGLAKAAGAVVGISGGLATLATLGIITVGVLVKLYLFDIKPELDRAQKEMEDYMNASAGERGKMEVPGFSSNIGGTILDWLSDAFGINPYDNLPDPNQGSGGRGATSIPLKADGGFVDRGQMFIANEAGPEMVGTVGNKTAVANNDMIIEGIKQGVMEALANSPVIAKLQIGETEFEQTVARAFRSYAVRTGV